MLLDKTELYVSSYSKRNQKSFQRIWVQGHRDFDLVSGIKELLSLIIWQTHTPLYLLRPDDSKRNRSSLIIHLLKYLKTMPT
jgi:hypothetical protein